MRAVKEVTPNGLFVDSQSIPITDVGGEVEVDREGEGEELEATGGSRQHVYASNRPVLARTDLGGEHKGLGGSRCIGLVKALADSAYGRGDLYEPMCDDPGSPLDVADSSAGAGTFVE